LKPGEETSRQTRDDWIDRSCLFGLAGEAA
jgi:hypothetical protein